MSDECRERHSAEWYQGKTCLWCGDRLPPHVHGFFCFEGMDWPDCIEDHRPPVVWPDETEARAIDRLIREQS